MDGINLKNVPQEAHNPRSNFDLSFTRKFDCKLGQLYPILCQPVMPGDEMSLSYQFLGRMAPFISQVFQDYKVRVCYYYVPSRIIWKNWANFMTAGYDGKQSFTHPYFHLYDIKQAYYNGSTTDGGGYYSIFNQMDIPLRAIMSSRANVAEHKINALPFGALIRVLYDYKIGTDTPLTNILQNIIADGYVFTDGDNLSRFMQYYNCFVTGNLNSGYAKMSTRVPTDLYNLDYFTSARANPQLGPVMTIPLELVDSSNGQNLFKYSNGFSSTNQSLVAYFTESSGSDKLVLSTSDRIGQPGYDITINGKVINNVATINDFYTAARVQEFLTLNGFSGFRPEDQIAAEFGVQNSDSRLHKTEFLGCNIHDYSINEVFSNNVNVPSSQSTEFTDLPGVGTAIAKINNAGNGFRHKFTEYGFVVGLLSCVPEAGYHEGLPRIYSTMDRFDYPHPMFANLGMQSIKQKEVYCDLSSTPLVDPEYDFAYVPRYYDWKVGVNRVNGQLQQQLCYMDASRRFEPLPNSGSLAAAPTFNDNFLRALPDQNNLNRTFNVKSNLPYDSPLFFDVKQNIYVNRELPYYGLPKF